MPAEIGIALVVLFVLIWLLFHLLAALLTWFDKARAERRARRFLRDKQRLSQHVHIFLPDELEQAQQELDVLSAQFHERRRTTVWTPIRPTWVKKPFLPLVFPSQTNAHGDMDIAEIESILCPNIVGWLEIESAIFSQSSIYPFAAPKGECLSSNELFKRELRLEKAVMRVDHTSITEKDVARCFRRERGVLEDYNKRRLAILSDCDHLNEQIDNWNVENHRKWSRYAADSASMAEAELEFFNLHSEQYSRACNEEKARFKKLAEGFRQRAKQGVVERVQCILGSLTLPDSVPRSWDIDFDEDQRILIVEIELPDVVHRQPTKTISLKSGRVKKSLNQAEKREYIPKVHPAILLRFAYELFRNDDSETIGLLVLNGWVRFQDPNTGIDTKAYTASLMVERPQILYLNLRKVEPLAAFQKLNGKSAGKIIDIIPIEPSLNLKRTDSRFVDAKAVLNTLNGATNLAAMDWQDFEHLIRELFEKEFGARGAEVKITQASRDRGVDAIAFDPDPIRGGKYVIQAKRYTKTVDVSAVRDLCAVVRKEGASRGILVATSTYGADAYAFADNEPVTLLDGAGLLGLLRKHGYSFRIDLQEARKLKPQLVDIQQRRA